MSVPPDQGCAALRLQLREPVQGTAPERAASWLLLEHPGPWPSTGWPADLPRAAVDVLDAAAELSVRPQLIRPLRERGRGGHAVIVASCRPGRRWLETRRLPDLGALADLDLAALAAGRRPGFGAATEEPVVLVCTHGRRDVCCARRGRPVAKVLDTLLPGRVWETSHVGGDRFAANVVTLPHGSYHGGLDPSTAPALAQAVLRGEVLLEQLRGTAGLPSAAQMAEFVVRRQLGLTGIDEVRADGPALHVDGCDELRVQVRPEQGGHRCFAVRLTRRQVPDVRLTSCAGAGTYARPYLLELAGLAELTDARDLVGG